MIVSGGGWGQDDPPPHLSFVFRGILDPDGSEIYVGNSLFFFKVLYGKVPLSESREAFFSSSVYSTDCDGSMMGLGSKDKIFFSFITNPV